MLLVFTSFVQATSIYRAHYCTHCCFGHNMLFWLACHFLFPRCLQLMRNKEHCMSLDVFGLHLRVFWSAMMLGVSPSIRRRFAKLHGVERVQKHLLHLVGKAMLAKVHSCLTYLSNLRSCSDMFLWFVFCKSFQLHRCLRQRGFLSGWLRTVANKGTAVLNLQNRSKFAKTIIVTDVVPCCTCLLDPSGTWSKVLCCPRCPYPGAGLCPIRINCGLGKSDQIAVSVIHRILYTLNYSDMKIKLATMVTVRRKPLKKWWVSLYLSMICLRAFKHYSHEFHLVVCCQTCLNSSRPPTRSLSRALWIFGASSWSR